MSPALKRLNDEMESEYQKFLPNQKSTNSLSKKLQAIDEDSHHESIRSASLFASPEDAR